MNYKSVSNDDIMCDYYYSTQRIIIPRDEKSDKNNMKINRKLKKEIMRRLAYYKNDNRIEEQPNE